MSDGTVPRSTTSAMEATGWRSAVSDGGPAATGHAPQATTWRGRDPTVAVAEAIAEAEGCDPDDLLPLFDSIDTDALNGLLRSAPGVEATFSHAGYAVTANGRGRVDVAPLEDD